MSSRPHGICAAVVASLLAHSVIISLWRFDEVPKPSRIEASASSRVTFQVTLPKPKERPVAAAARPRAGSRASTKAQTNNKLPPPTNSSMPAPEPSYSSLLPRGGELSQTVGAESPGISSGLSDSDTLPAEIRNRDLGRLSIAARDMAEHTMVPVRLFEIQQAGSARATLSRGAGRWKLVDVNGDPYTRAILFHALSDYLENLNGKPVELDESGC